MARQLMQRYDPEYILLVYKGEEYNQVYIEKQLVVRGKLMERHPLLETEMNALGKNLWKQESEYISGEVPDKIKYINYQHDKIVLVWQTPPQIVKLLFNEEIGIEDGLYPMPSLIWRYHNGNLQVAASLLNDAQLYHPPLGNIGVNFRVCMGTADRFVNRKFKTFKQLVDSVEHSFWNSRFTHFNEGMLPCKGNVFKLYESIKGKENFPIKKLIRSQISMNEFYETN